jgi:hypothetical protein
VGDQVVDVAGDASPLLSQRLPLEVRPGSVELRHERLLTAQSPTREEAEDEPSGEEQGRPSDG